MSRGKAPNRFTTTRTSNLRDAMEGSLAGPKIPRTRAQMKERIQEVRNAQSHMIITGPRRNKLAQEVEGVEKLINEALGTDCHMPYNCHMRMTFRELVGGLKFDPAPNKYAWSAGPLTQAMTNGSVMLLENAEMMPVGVMQQVALLFDEKGPQIDPSLTGPKGKLTPAEGFCLILTMPLKPEKGPLLEMANKSQVLEVTKRML
jgi:midasin (ATPase involved in ribosome maturation)